MDTYEGKFFICEEKAPPRNDGRIQLIELDAPYNKDELIKLIRFGHGDVNVVISENNEDIKNPLTFEQEFYFLKADRKPLKQGDRLRVVLRCSYSAESREQLVKFESKDIKIFMEKIQKEIFDGSEEEREEDDE